MMIPKGKKPGRIKPKRLTSSKHLAFVAEQPCCCCGVKPVTCHHLLRADPKRGTGRKAGDQYVVPMCPTCHHGLHMRGDEIAFFEARDVDGPALARNLAAASPDPKIRSAAQ